jgi:outer membrane protein OmpA-like peptidoglycan-associated protein
MNKPTTFVRACAVSTAVAASGLLLSGCGQSQQPTHIAVIAGARQAVPAVFNRVDPAGASLQVPSLGSALRSAAQDDLDVSVLTADGDPRAAATLSLKVDRNNPKTASESADQNTSSLAGAILAAKAATPESNMIAALDIAGRSSSEIFVQDSGLATTGPLMFQNGLLGPRTKVDDIVDQLKTAGNLPSLKGAKVRWWGLGQVNSPQSTPPVWAKDKLKALYTAIITAAGGTVDFVDDPIPAAPTPAGLPAVTPVAFSDATAEPTALTLPESALGFLGDSADFADPAAAAATLDSVAKQLGHAPHGTVYVTGCTAFPPGSNAQALAALSQLRAAAVVRELTSRGATGLMARGFGADCPGRVPDRSPSGEALSAAQQLNRKVLITTADIRPVPAR